MRQICQRGISIDRCSSNESVNGCLQIFQLKPNILRTIPLNRPHIRRLFESVSIHGSAREGRHFLELLTEVDLVNHDLSLDILSRNIMKPIPVRIFH